MAIGACLEAHVLFPLAYSFVEVVTTYLKQSCNSALSMGSCSDLSWLEHSQKQQSLSQSKCCCFLRKFCLSRRCACNLLFLTKFGGCLGDVVSLSDVLWCLGVSPGPYIWMLVSATTFSPQLRCTKHIHRNRYKGSCVQYFCLLKCCVNQSKIVCLCDNYMYFACYVFLYASQL